MGNSYSQEVITQKSEYPNSKFGFRIFCSLLYLPFFQALKVDVGS
jgi:hypothetical protein